MKTKNTVSIAFTLAIIVGAGLFAFNALTNDSSLQVATLQEGLHISHKGMTLLPKEDFVISFSEIDDATLMHQLPTMRRTNGLGNSVVQIGAFRSDELGEFRAYVWAKKSPHLFIRTTSGKAYLVTPDDAAGIYAQLQGN